ncbi:MAG: helix-turn-helix domain-containing protein [Lachnospiraceae bacterium]
MQKERGCQEIGWLLMAVGDKGKLVGYYKDVLGRLEEYDRSYGTNYMEVLQRYLENDASVQLTAQQMYVHRNTINYQIRKIRDIIGCSLTSMEDRLTIFLAFKVRDQLMEEYQSKGA